MEREEERATNFQKTSEADTSNRIELTDIYKLTTDCTGTAETI